MSCELKHLCRRGKVLLLKWATVHNQGRHYYDTTVNITIASSWVSAGTVVGLFKILPRVVTPCVYFSVRRSI